MRFVRLMLVSALLLMSFVASGSYADSAGGCAHHSAGWSKVSPKFDAGPTQNDVANVGPNSVVSWLEPPDDPDVMLATDGAEIVRSADGGCRWTTVFTVTGALAGVDADLAPSNGMPYYVAHLVGPPVASGSGVVYALLVPGFGAVVAGALTTEPPLLVAASKDNGKTWALTMPNVGATQAVPHCQQLRWVAVSPRNPHLLEVICLPGAADGVTNAYGAYRTTDDGATWTSFTTPAGWSYALGQMLAADPQDPLGLWALIAEYENNSERLLLSHSVDGQHWSTPTTVFDHLNYQIAYGNEGIEATAGAKTGSVRLLAWAPIAGAVESTDGGRHWAVVAKGPGAAAVLRGGATLITYALSLPNRDVVTVGAYGTTCRKGSRTVITRYRGARHQAERLPDVPKAWGGQLGGLSGMQVAENGAISVLGWASTGTADSPCGTSFLADYRGPR